MRRFSWKFFLDDAGTTGVLFGLLTMPMILLIGVAVDTAEAYRIKTQLQDLVDKATIAGAKLPATANENRKKAAEGIYAANLKLLGLQGVTHTVEATNAEVRVTANYTHPTAVMKIVGYEEMPMEVTAAARSQVENGGVACILALNESAPDGFHLQGINDANSHNCWVWVNSNTSTSINADGAATATAQGFCTVGGVSGAEHFAPPPYSDCAKIDDPFYDKFASYNANVGQCKETDLLLKSGTYTLTPGTYCGDTILKPHAHVTLQPGTYNFLHGKLQVQAGASLTGNGVTLFFLGFDTWIEVRGGADIDLKAPDTGELAGFVLVDRKLDWYNPNIYETVIQGGGRIHLEGIVYAPQWRMNISGNGELNQDSKCFAMVADHFYMEGNGKLNVVADCDTVGLPELMPKIKSGPKMVE